ncbi:MAG: iron ABC transporter [Elusimicrobia bacterium RIFCSPLOWO2_01_FULL_64_13]|nr:MAG: iron ABC transporter [Elusimicrobia bacterium RIFCSPLOWO2_01_FULL_64_13]
MTGTSSAKQGKLALLVLAAGAALLLAPFLGTRFIAPSSVLPAASGAESRIFWSIRMPRVLLAFLVGSGLSVSGMVFQAMFRNPLATPFTLGVSSGASLGTAVYVRLGLSFSLLFIPGLTWFAFLGALLTILIVYGIARASRGFSAGNMLLSGVAVGLFFSSAILFIQYTSNFGDAYRILRWLMGGLETVGYGAVLNLLPLILAGGAAVLYLSRELDLLTTGEELAASRGVNVDGTRKALFLITSLMVGATVSVSGPIGFVGMMVPHICRILIGSEHRFLAPAALLSGGVFLVLCDLLARTVIAPAEVPVGIITALLGGPFFLWLLIRRWPDT